MGIDLLSSLVLSDPRISVGTTAERPATATDGTPYYNTDTNQLEIYDGGWISLGYTPKPGDTWTGYGTSTQNFTFTHGSVAMTHPVARTGNTIIAARDASYALRSLDGGATWSLTGVFPETTTSYWGGLSTGLGLFVAVHREMGYGFCVTSTDGASWTSRTMPAAVRWMDTAFNGTTFVAVAKASGGGATTQAAYSANGTAWSSATMPTSTNWTTVCWDGTKFIAVAETPYTAVSTDGITWAAGGTIGSAAIAGLTTDGAGTCLFPCGEGGVYYSLDHGATWTLRDISGNANHHIHYADGYFYAVPWSSGAGYFPYIYRAAVADVGKPWSPIPAPRMNMSSSNAYPNQGTAWVLHNGTALLAGTPFGILRG